MIKIDASLIQPVLDKSVTAERKRMNYNFHKESSDTMHRMLNAMQPSTYIAPHKHEKPDKREAFIILMGRILIITFNEQGAITNHLIMDRNTNCFGAEIPPKTYHTLISLEKNSILFEIKDGPYVQATDKVFAPWAPMEGEEGTLEFNNSLLKKVGLI